MKQKTTDEGIFDFEAEVTKLLATPEVQKSFARPEAKALWIQYLQDEESTAQNFEVDENDRVVADMIFSLLTTYAFLAAHAEFSSNPEVNRYMELFGQLYAGQDVQQEIDEATTQLPEGFKETVNEAGRVAHAYLLKRLQAA